VRKTRRNSSQPVIDYDLILVMQPNLLRTPYTADYQALWILIQALTGLPLLLWY
jgi:hypothetical protein